MKLSACAVGVSRVCWQHETETLRLCGMWACWSISNQNEGQHSDRDRPLVLFPSARFDLFYLALDDPLYRMSVLRKFWIDSRRVTYRQKAHQ